MSKSNKSQQNKQDEYGASAPGIQNEWYSFDQIKKALRKLLPQEIEAQIGFDTQSKEGFKDDTNCEIQNLDHLNLMLDWFAKNKNKVGTYIIPINLHSITKKLPGQLGGGNGHWVCLYVTIAANKPKTVYYIDPMGHPIDEDIQDIIVRSMRPCDMEQPMRGIGLQYARLMKTNTEDGAVEYYEGNTDDCGPMLVYSILRLVRPDLPIIFSSTEAESRAVGQILRTSFQVDGANIGQLKTNITQFLEAARQHDHTRYLESFDDSSDEEDEVEDYDVKGAYDKAKIAVLAKQLQQDGNEETKPELKLSFITHALGIRRLYSKVVQQKYYALKRQYLKHQEDELPKEEDLKQWFKAQFKKTIIEVMDSSGELSGLAKDLFRSFEGNYAAALEGIIQLLVDHKRELMRISSVSHINALDDSLAECFTIIKTLLLEHITMAVEADVFDGYGNIEDIATEIASKMPKNNNGTLSINSPKLQAARVDVLAPYSPSMKKKIEGAFDQAVSLLKGRGVQKTLQEKFEEDLVDQLPDDTYSLLQEILEDSLLDVEFVRVLHTAFSSFISQKIQERRRTLDDFHKFDLSDTEALPDFQEEFLATLRLCNRSQARVVKNRKDLDDGYEYLEEEGTSRAWKFPASTHEAIDMQRLSTKANRNDRTESAGSYKTVYEKLKQVKILANKNKPPTAVAITDHDLAHWIDQIINGKKLDKLTYYHDNRAIDFINKHLLHNIARDLVQISYLIFGSEVMRNPAALVHNHMMLDLVKADELTWKKALAFYFNADQKEHGGLMPMSMKGAVDQARDLHTGYFDFMPHQYVYDKRTPISIVKVSELAQREYIATLYWLCMRMQKDPYLASYFAEDTTYIVGHKKELLEVVCGQIPPGGLLTLKDDKIDDLYQYIWNVLYPDDAVNTLDAEFMRLGGIDFLA